MSLPHCAQANAPEVYMMSRKLNAQTVGLILVILVLGYCLGYWTHMMPSKQEPAAGQKAAAAQASQSESSSPPQPLKNSEDAYNAGLAFEAAGDFAQAMKQYETARKKFPNHSPAAYRIAILLEQQGKAKEAIDALREVVKSPNSPKELLEDARQRIQRLSWPQLTREQQEALDAAVNYLQTGENLKKENEQAEKKTEVYQVPLEHAVKLLERLREEKPDYLPLYFRLAIAYELLSEHLDAYDNHQYYLDGYHKLNLPITEMQHEIQSRMMVCEAILHLRTNEVFVSSYFFRDYFISLAEDDPTNRKILPRFSGVGRTDPQPTKLHLDKVVGHKIDFRISSAKWPGFFLRPQEAGSEEMIFAPFDDDTQRKESVFKIVDALGTKQPGWVSFESRSRPNWFIVASYGRNYRQKIFLREKKDAEDFRKSATFRIIGPSVGGLR